MIYKSWNWKWSFRLVCRFSLVFIKISCFISKNILSKVVLKYEASMLTFHRAYPKIHFRIMRTVNPLLQLYINRRFQKYISVSSCHCHRVYFKRSLFILSLLFLKTMNGVISCYVLVLQVKHLSGVSRSVLL